MSWIKFSPAERPNASRAYTHKLDFELDTAFHIFKRLPEGRWLRGLELETSLDYLATGLPKKGDVFCRRVALSRRRQPLVVFVRDRHSRRALLSGERVLHRCRLDAYRRSLLCGYSSGVGPGEGFNTICDRHSHVVAVHAAM